MASWAPGCPVAALHPLFLLVTYFSNVFEELLIVHAVALLSCPFSGAANGAHLRSARLSAIASGGFGH